MLRHGRNQETEEVEQLPVTKDRLARSSERAPEVKKDCSCHDLRLKSGYERQEGIDSKTN